MYCDCDTWISRSGLETPFFFSRSMYWDSGGDGTNLPFKTPQGPLQGKEPPTPHYTLVTETPTPLTSQSRAQRQLNFEAQSIGEGNPNRRIVIVPTHDDPHMGPLGAVGLSKKFPDSDEGSNFAQSKQPDDDQGDQGSGSKPVNHTNQNGNKDEGPNVTTRLIMKSKTDESKRVGEPADLSLATIPGSLGSDEDISMPREAIDDGVNGELVFPVMQLLRKDVVVVVLPLHSWQGGVENSELVI